MARRTAGDAPGTDLAALHDFAVAIARQAGAAVVAERARGSLTVGAKAGTELVTSADMASHRLLTEAIAARHPGHLVISEEGGEPDWEAVAGGAPAWVIDPVDGTANLAHGHPLTAVSVAFVTGGRSTVGAVHAPLLGETFSAARGQGAWLDGAPIAVRAAREVADAVVATGFPHVRDDIDALVRRVGLLVAHCRDIRRSGCPTLDICWVGAGRLDGYYETPAPWDVAAAGLVALEAGARRAHLTPPQPPLPEDLAPTDVVFAAPELLDPLVELLRR